MRALPTGTVTFLFTDIEGSTGHLRELGDRYPAVLADHRQTLRAAVAEHDGAEVDTQGDAFFVAFSRRFFDEYGQVSWDPEEVERGLAAARSELGATRFAEAWRAGHRLTRDEAVVLARTIAEQATTTAPAP